MKKSLIMMYPIKEFVDTHPSYHNINSVGLYRWEKLFSDLLNLNRTAFRQRFRMLNRLRINQYRKAGFEVNWVYFGREEDKSVPDERTHSEIFTVFSQDKKISTGLAYVDLRNRIYPDSFELVRKSGNPEKLVVGGFHESDCVARLACVSNSSTDIFLTERFFSEVLKTFNFDFDGKLIKDGKLNAEMHEDIPAEEKRMTIEMILKHELKL